MDQLKIFLAVVKKYQFWFLCGAMLITSLVCWWLANSSLATKFKTRKSQIESDFQGVRVAPNHPNQEVINKIKSQQDLLKQGVNTAWKALYEEQEKQSTFPVEVLGADFAKKFKLLRPKDELANVYLERYKNHIREYLPTLKTIINALRPTNDSRSGETDVGRDSPQPPHAPSGASVGDQNAEMPMTGIVAWNGADYANLESRFHWPQSSPSTFEVILAQEDLSVYEALLRVIAKVNKGATTQSNASIKQLDALEIGKDAEKAWKEYEQVLFTRAGGGASPSAGGAAAAGSQSEHDRMVLRYVDAKGEPLPVEAEYPYVRFPAPQFKMMPIHLSLVMDQQDLPKLLVECANSSMPIEVRRLFINEKTSPSKTATTGRHDSSTGQPEDVLAQESPGKTDVSVHILAAIYIYNPPDSEKTDNGQATQP